MNTVIQSLSAVVGGQGFPVFMSIIFTLGMYFGNRHDDGFRGFKKSVGIIAPWSMIVILTNVFRILEVSKYNTVTSAAYNGSITAFLATVCYIPGLFIGHMIKQAAEKQAIREHNKNTREAI